MSTTQRPQATVSIRLTDRANEQVKRFIEQEQVPLETAGLRVAVLPGGCSGFKYGLNVEERPLDDDMVLETQGLRVFVDAFSAQYLDGVTIVPRAGAAAGARSPSEPVASGAHGGTGGLHRMQAPRFT
ncbi:MAG: iron-sulfur cluster assembly accessory protein [Gemmatimonadetes bacterium]|nr:iron-sulfur cluster assembly accessory protein [Gemmatimonadota bacterium]